LLIFPQKPEEQYYNVIDFKGPTVIVFGEVSEHWTAQAIEFIERNNPSIYFLPWSKVANLRLQLNLFKYPVTQLWRSKEMVREVVGYHEDLLEDLMHKFFSK
jgi:hypothetical protein